MAFQFFTIASFELIFMVAHNYSYAFNSLRLLPRREDVEEAVNSLALSILYDCFLVSRFYDRAREYRYYSFNSLRLLRALGRTLDST